MIAQFLLNGVVTGAVYVLMALGFALIYNTTRIFHLAHGVIALISSYVMFLVAVRLGWGLLPGVISAVLAAAVLGGATELSFYRALRRHGAGPSTFAVGSF